MTKNEWLRGEIGKWERDGILIPETAEKLRGLYPAEAHRIPLAVMIFSCVGAVLLALGVIALLAANWDCFKRPARTVVSVLPFILCGIAALTASIRGWRSRNFWEPLGILWSSAIFTGILMISQIYQVTESFPDFILVCAAATLPVVYVTRATVPLALWPSLLAIGVCCKWESMAAVVYWPLLLTIIPAFVLYWRKTISPFGRGIADLGLALAVTIGGYIALGNFINSFSYSFTFLPPFVFSTLAAVILLAGLRFKMLFLPLAGLGCLVFFAAVVLPFESVLDDVFRWRGNTSDPNGIWQVVAYALMLVIAGVALLLSIIRSGGKKAILLFAALPIFAVTFAPVAIAVKSYWLLSIFGLCVIVAYGLGTLVNGLKTRRLMIVNAGTVMLLYAILVKFFVSDVSFTVKGIVMTVLGATVLIMNTVWCVRRRKFVVTTAMRD